METFDKLINQSDFIVRLMRQIPLYALILDQKRQIVFSNDYFLIENEINNASEVFGKGPGDVFQCENAEEAGCGNSLNCKFCGIFKTITECMEKKSMIIHSCKLMVNRKGFVIAYEFMARCSPIQIQEDTYYLLTLTDISAESRKRILERIFFHDVLNMLNGLSGLTSILQELNKQEDITKYILMISNISDRLSETISSQNDLINAEKRELNVNLKQVSASNIISSVVESSVFKTQAYEKQVIVKELKTDFTVITDSVLLSRVLINMLKNAMEAPNRKDEIRIGGFQSDEKASFYVHNYAFIEETDAKYIFKPMFSTKGSTRGLGTYSMLLIGENYLKGKVRFESSLDTGTLFTIEIPIKNDI